MFLVSLLSRQSRSTRRRNPTPRHVAPFTDVSPAKRVYDELASTAVTCACGCTVKLSAAGEHLADCSAARDANKAAEATAQNQWRRHVSRLVPSRFRGGGTGGGGGEVSGGRTSSSGARANTTTTHRVLSFNSARVASASPAAGAEEDAAAVAAAAAAAAAAADDDDAGDERGDDATGDAGGEAPAPSGAAYVNRTTFTCPLCVQDQWVVTGAEDHPGCHLDCDGLINHLENHHHAGTSHPRPAVCPVCAAMPWGGVPGGTRGVV